MKGEKAERKGERRGQQQRESKELINPTAESRCRLLGRLKGTVALALRRDSARPTSAPAPPAASTPINATPSADYYNYYYYYYY